MLKVLIHTSWGGGIITVLTSCEHSKLDQRLACQDIPTDAAVIEML